MDSLIFPGFPGRSCFYSFVVISILLVVFVRVFFMPLGFHEDILLRAMLNLRVRGGDFVYVVTCGPLVGAVKRAYESLRAMCLRQGFPEPSLIELNCRDFYGSVKSIRQLISSIHDADIYLCSGAGLRILTHIIEIALLASRRVFNLYYEPEAEGVEPILIPSTLYLNIYKSPRGREEDILKLVISNPGLSVKDITQSIRVKEKTARNILTRLKNMGLVKRIGRDRVQATELAIALYS
jgi:CRISPR locus-related DNA-binding protein